MRDSQEEIIGLLDQQEIRRGGDDNNEKGHQVLGKPNLTLIVVAILSILIAIDIAAYAYIARLLTSQVVTDDLAFKSSYVGLDELYKFGGLKPSHYNRTLNMPRTAIQVNRNEPDKFSFPHSHQWLSNFGTLAPPDRHLQVSNSVRTLLQFRVLDFGMEKCTLALRLPALGDKLPHPYRLGDGSAQEISLHVCQLDYARTLSERVTWNNKPRCLKGVTIMRGVAGTEVESEPFSCASGSHLAYEISCTEDNPNCLVDVWSNQNATWGMFLYQYQTLTL